MSGHIRLIILHYKPLQYNHHHHHPFHFPSSGTYQTLVLLSLIACNCISSRSFVAYNYSLQISFSYTFPQSLIYMLHSYSQNIFINKSATMKQAECVAFGNITSKMMDACFVAVPHGTVRAKLVAAKACTQVVVSPCEAMGVQTKEDEDKQRERKNVVLSQSLMRLKLGKFTHLTTNNGCQV